jgi:hypothetical protein
MMMYWLDANQCPGTLLLGQCLLTFTNLTLAVIDGQREFVVYSSE